MNNEQIFPRTIRKVGTGKDTVKFLALGRRGLYIYGESGPDEKSINEPNFDRFRGRFVLNSQGEWTLFQPSCLEIIKYLISPRVKTVEI